MILPESHAHSPTDRTPERSAAYFFTRLLGWLSIALGFAMPVVATAAPGANITHYVPLALGFLPAGLFLTTRGYPRRASSAVIAAILLPTGAAALAFGALTTPFNRRGAGIEPVIAGVILLVIGILHAWVSWAPTQKRPTQVAAQLMGVAIWIIFGVLSLQTIAADDEITYIEPLAMQLDGRELSIEVPHQGGCANSNLSVETKLRAFGILEVLVFDEHGDFRCLASCLSDWRAICTETLRHTLPQLPPIGTTVVAARRPATGLQRVPFAFVISGILLGGTLWVAGARMGPE